MNSMLFFAAFLTLTTFAVTITKEFGECRCLDREDDPKYRNDKGEVEGDSCDNPINTDNGDNVLRYCYVYGPACEAEGIVSFRSSADVFEELEDVHFSFHICTKSLLQTIDDLENELNEEKEKAQTFEVAANEKSEEFENQNQELQAQVDQLTAKAVVAEEKLAKYAENIPSCYAMIKALKKEMKTLKKIDGNDSSDEENQ